MKIKVRSIGLAVLMGVAIGSTSISQAIAFPYQDISEEFYRKEKEKWHEVIKREPKNTNAYLELGKLLESEARVGYWSDCAVQEIEVYRQAIAFTGANAEIHFKLGQALITDLDNSGHCDISYLGDAAKIKARKKEGLSHLLKATLDDRSNDDYLIALGDSLKEEDQLDAAIVVYKAAVDLKLNPNQDSTLAYYKSMQYGLIGDKLLEKADFKAAEAAYRKALAIEPSNTHVQDRLKKVRNRLIRRFDF